MLINYTCKLLKFLHTFFQLHAFLLTICVCVYVCSVCVCVVYVCSVCVCVVYVCSVCACVVYVCGVCVIVSSNLKFLHTFFSAGMHFV